MCLVLYSYRLRLCSIVGILKCLGHLLWYICIYMFVVGTNKSGCFDPKRDDLEKLEISKTMEFPIVHWKSHKNNIL